MWNSGHLATLLFVVQPRLPHGSLELLMIPAKSPKVAIWPERFLILAALLLDMENPGHEARGYRWFIGLHGDEFNA